MRASLYLIGFAAASIAGAGAVQIGCSSSSSGTTPTGGEDAATDTGTTPPVDAGPAADTATTCTAIVPGANVETLPTPNTPGLSSWSCLQMACKKELTACGADCECNNDVLTSLLCTADGGTSSTCFEGLLASSDTNDVAVLNCLSPQTMDGGACLPLPLTSGDGGTEAGPADAGGGG